jgi:hypothetical protein
MQQFNQVLHLLLELVIYDKIVKLGVDILSEDETSSLI